MPTTTGIATEFIQFSRTSNATVTDSDGKIKWAPANLLTNSESFDASAWSKNAATVGANSIAAPNGTTTADTLTSTGAGCYVLQSYSAISGTVTVSVFAKPGTNNSVLLRVAQAGNGYETSFTLSGSGTAGTPTIVGTGGTVSGMTAAISSLANSWYLCTITFAETGLGNVFILQSATSGTIYLWGAALYRSDLGGMQPNTSAYPLYNPTTPKNLLGFTESLTTGWTNTNTTDAIAGEVNPNGLTGAVDVAATAGNGTLLSSISLLASPYTFSIWLKRKTGSGTVEITVDGTTYVAAAVTNTWTRFSTTLTPAAGTATPGIRIVTSGDAVYAWGAQLSDSASLDPYFPSYSTAPTAVAYYGPRRDFDGSTLACKGLLVEELRVNVVPNSSAFGSWTNNAVTVNADTVVAPDGTTTADELVRTTATSDNRNQTVTFTGNGTKSVSIYVKYNTSPSFALFLYDSTAVANRMLIEFSFTGVVPSASITTIGSVEAIENVGNGWYRIKVLCPSVVAANTNVLYVYPARTGSANLQKTSFWGAQAENGTFATSYMPTVATTFQRNADVASVSAQAFPYLQGTGTIIANFDSYGEQAGSNSYTAVSLADGTSANTSARIYVYSNFSGGTTRNSSITQADLSVTGWSQNIPLKGAYAFANNDFQYCASGTLSTPDTLGTVPTNISTMVIGSNYSFGGWTNGHIRQITYLPRRLTNAELQTRTA